MVVKDFQSSINQILGYKGLHASSIFITFLILEDGNFYESVETAVLTVR